MVCSNYNILISFYIIVFRHYDMTKLIQYVFEILQGQMSDKKDKAAKFCKKLIITHIYNLNPKMLKAESNRSQRFLASVI